MLPESTPLGSKLQQARQAAALSRAELAAVIGATERAVQFWETGQRMPRMRYLRAISAATEKPVAWFFEEVAA